MTPSTILTDVILLELVKKNDEVAIATLLDRYKDKFYTAIFLLVKDKYIAEDLFQEVCIKIITCIRNGNYNDDGRFLSWTMRICRNLALDYFRANKRKVKVTLSDGTDIFSVFNFGKEESFEKTMMQEETAHRLRKMLDMIPYDQREVIVLRMYGNMSFKQIAEMTSTSVNTALGRMRYGLLHLRKIMDEKGILL